MLHLEIACELISFIELISVIILYRRQNCYWMWAITYNYRKSNPNLQSQARCQHFNCSWGSAVTPQSRGRMGRDLSSVGRNILHKEPTLVRHDSNLEGCQPLVCRKIRLNFSFLTIIPHAGTPDCHADPDLSASVLKFAFLGERFWKILGDTSTKYGNHTLPPFVP